MAAPDRGRRGLPTQEDFVHVLPEETAALLEKCWERSASDNLGLWLDRHIPRPWSTPDLKADHRAVALSQVCEPMTSSAVLAAARRQAESLEELAGRADGTVIRGRYEVRGRLLVDYGRANALETTLSFHPATGAPHIPGSAIKGAARAWLKSALDGARTTHKHVRDLLEDRLGKGGTTEDPSGKRLCTEQDLAVLRYPERLPVDLFGSEPGVKDGHVAGIATFLEALPADGKYQLALDILNPHVSAYYQKMGPPGEWLSPKPHTFLTVVRTQFALHAALLPRRCAAPSCLGADSRDGWFDLSPADRKHALNLLAAVLDASIEGALKEQGIGAKTAAGYGRLKRKQL